MAKAREPQISARVIAAPGELRAVAAELRAQILRRPANFYKLARQWEVPALVYTWLNPRQSGTLQMAECVTFLRKCAHVAALGCVNCGSAQHTAACAETVQLLRRVPEKSKWRLPDLLLLVVEQLYALHSRAAQLSLENVMQYLYVCRTQAPGAKNEVMRVLQSRDVAVNPLLTPAGGYVPQPPRELQKFFKRPPRSPAEFGASFAALLEGVPDALAPRRTLRLRLPAAAPADADANAHTWISLYDLRSQQRVYLVRRVGVDAGRDEGLAWRFPALRRNILTANNNLAKYESRG